MAVVAVGELVELRCADVGHDCSFRLVGVSRSLMVAALEGHVERMHP